MLWRIGCIALLAVAIGPTLPARSNLHAVLVRVVDADTGRPIGNAEVTIPVRQDSGFTGLTGHTDRSGRAWFPGLAAGRTSIRARHPGYYDARAEMPGPSMPITLGDSPLPALVTIQLTRGGTISGSLHDEFGEPIAGLQVKLLARRLDSDVPVQTAITDDRGDYRFSGLRSERYLVGVTPQYLPRVEDPDSPARRQDPASTTMIQGWSGDVDLLPERPPPLPAPVSDIPLLGYASTFYPGVDAADASFVDLAAGENRAGIDFSMRTTPLGFVTGVVVGRPDGPPAPIGLVFVPMTARDFPEPIPAASSDLNGRFVSPFLPYGTYTLVASLKRKAGEDQYSARLSVTVDANTATTPLVVRLERTSR